MQDPNASRHRLLSPKYYLFWCIFQILVVVSTLIVICTTFVAKTSKLVLFRLELVLIFLMILDIFLYAWTFGFHFSVVFVVEVNLILLSFGIIVLACFEKFDYLLEEYDYILILVRTLIQIIRLTVVTTKTNFTSNVNSAQNIKIKLDDVEINESNVMGKFI